jgi:hypothetical protein
VGRQHVGDGEFTQLSLEQQIQGPLAGFAPAGASFGRLSVGHPQTRPR